jgi:hypothetical protein
MTDRTTKILLGFIAFGLWANLAVPLFQPQIATAQSAEEEIQHDLHNIYNGACPNHKIC